MLEGIVLYRLFTYVLGFDFFRLLLYCVFWSVFESRERFNCGILVLIWWLFIKEVGGVIFVENCGVLIREEINSSERYFFFLRWVMLIVFLRVLLNCFICFKSV